MSDDNITQEEDAKKEEEQHDPPLLSSRLAPDGTTEYALSLLNFPHYTPNTRILWCSPDQYAFIPTMSTLQEFLLHLSDHQVIRDLCGDPKALGVRALFDAVMHTIVREFDPHHHQGLLTRASEMIGFYRTTCDSYTYRTTCDSYTYRTTCKEKPAPYGYLVYAMLVASLMKIERRGLGYTPETLALAQEFARYAQHLHYRQSFSPDAAFDAAYGFVMCHITLLSRLG